MKFWKSALAATVILTSTSANAATVYHTNLYDDTSTTYDLWVYTDTNGMGTYGAGEAAMYITSRYDATASDVMSCGVNCGALTGGPADVTGTFPLGHVTMVESFTVGYIADFYGMEVEGMLGIDTINGDSTYMELWHINSVEDIGSYYQALDYLTIELQTSPVPVPAAAWLFGSGLIGLIGVARRKMRT